MNIYWIVGVVAAVAVLLIAVLLVARRRRMDDEPMTDDTVSFLDAPMHDTLGRLGEAEHEPEIFAPEAATPAESERQHGEAEPHATLGLGLDWGNGVPPAGREVAAESDDAEITGNLGRTPGLDEPCGAAQESPAAATREPAPSPSLDPGGRRLPLSDILATTSAKVVDVDDPEVRRMLADLVTFEIDQAIEYRRQGQTGDAALQLKEAEKICGALGLGDTAERIRQMMAGL